MRGEKGEKEREEEREKEGEKRMYTLVFLNNHDLIALLEAELVLGGGVVVV